MASTRTFRPTKQEREDRCLRIRHYGRRSESSLDVVDICLTALDSEILSGRIPFHDIEGTGAVITAVFILDQRPPKEPIASATGESYEEIWSLMDRCWSKDPNVRPPIKEARAILTPPSSAFTEEPEAIVPAAEIRAALETEETSETMSPTEMSVNWSTTESTVFSTFVTAARFAVAVVLIFDAL